MAEEKTVSPRPRNEPQREHPHQQQTQSNFFHYNHHEEQKLHSHSQSQPLCRISKDVNSQINNFSNTEIVDEKRREQFPDVGESLGKNISYKFNIHEMSNHEYISRLMAATPPYLYSTPISSNYRNFFFSDILRSLVATHNQNNIRSLELQQTAALSRRTRKRPWSQCRSYGRDIRIEEGSSKQKLSPRNTAVIECNEKPLELTTTTTASNTESVNSGLQKLFHRHFANVNHTDVENQQMSTGDQITSMTKPFVTISKTGNDDCVESIMADGSVNALIQSTSSADSLPLQDLVLPILSTPSVWYPSIYPAYNIDPLHFFIDLRVSGHIFDRKKDNILPTTNFNNNLPEDIHALSSSKFTDSVRDVNDLRLNITDKTRYASAFTVPKPKFSELKHMAPSLTPVKASNTPLTAINPSHKIENNIKHYDFGERKENQLSKKQRSVNYMLKFAGEDIITQSNSNIINDINNNSKYHIENQSEVDSDSGHRSVENYADRIDEGTVIIDNHVEREIDIEFIDSKKYHIDGESSHCNSSDDITILSN